MLEPRRAAGRDRELNALTTLNLTWCIKLAVLPAEIGELNALATLELACCSKLMFPPQHLHGDVNRIKRLLAITIRFLDKGLSAKIADDDAKADFLEIIKHAPFADRLGEAVRKDSSLADLTNDNGERAIDLAILPCRRAMQRALFFLGRYAIAEGSAEHRSATSLVVVECGGLCGWCYFKSLRVTPAP